MVHNFPIVPVLTHSSGLCPVSLNAYSPCEDAELALNQGGRIVSDKTQIVLCPDLEADCSPGTDLGIGDLVVIEIPISAGDFLVQGDTYVTLECDKASIELPSPLSGRVVKMFVKIGDKVTTQFSDY